MARTLADLDPLFSAPVGPAAGAGTTTAGAGNTTQSAAQEPYIDPMTGLAVGSGIGLLAPKMPTASDAQAKTAQARAKATAAGVESAQADLAKQTAAHQARMAQTQSLFDAAQATHAKNMAEYNQLRDLMSRAGLPFDPHEHLSEASGDKWSRKVVGSMGPGGESVTEASRNYRTQQALTPEESSKFKVGRSGIIEPNDKLPTTPENKADLMKRFREVEQRTLQSYQDMSKHQGILDSLNRKGPISSQRASSVASKVDKAAEARAYADELLRMNRGANVAKIFSKIPGVLSGAGMGYEAAEAFNALKQGDVTGAILPGMSALGGVLSMVPHPIAKAIGYPMQMAPLAYQAYQSYMQPEQQPTSAAQPLPPLAQ